jgi:hypothetical protein
MFRGEPLVFGNDRAALPHAQIASIIRLADFFGSIRLRDLVLLGKIATDLLVGSQELIGCPRQTALILDIKFDQLRSAFVLQALQLPALPIFLIIDFGGTVTRANWSRKSSLKPEPSLRLFPMTVISRPDASNPADRKTQAL